MNVSVGTFNLNNLFSRDNFSGVLDALVVGGTDVTVKTEYDFTDPTTFALRTFRGRLVRGKDPKDTAAIAARILEMDVDVLACQEVEDVETLRRFHQEHLGGRYPFAVLVEGNDARLSDVAMLPKLTEGSPRGRRPCTPPTPPPCSAATCTRSRS